MDATPTDNITRWVMREEQLLNEIDQLRSQVGRLKELAKVNFNLYCEAMRDVRKLRGDAEFNGVQQALE